MKSTRIYGIFLMLFFSAYASYLFMNAAMAEDEIYYILTKPVDPRDYLSGTYVALNYEIESLPSGINSCANLPVDALISVKLGKAKTVQSEVGDLDIYEIAECANSIKKEAGWVSAHKYGKTIKYRNINRFYLNENDTRKNNTSPCAVKIKIGKDKNPIILDVIKLQ